jgi:hypothetical protein
MILFFKQEEENSEESEEEDDDNDNAQDIAAISVDDENLPAHLPTQNKLTQQLLEGKPEEPVLGYPDITTQKTMDITKANTRGILKRGNTFTNQPYNPTQKLPNIPEMPSISNEFDDGMGNEFMMNIPVQAIPNEDSKEEPTHDRDSKSQNIDEANSDSKSDDSVDDKSGLYDPSSDSESVHYSKSDDSDNEEKKEKIKINQNQ